MKTKEITENFSAELLKVDKRSFQFLKQIPSPLNYAALTHDYKPFNFKFEAEIIYILPQLVSN